ncbi:DUF6600 domain-containing protein [Legionella yabuuchiae]|uniref:DUF6600 domain-containing protein n=1 Tax=Legionella yabuuchiae TaxID=376727 RepID=UPI0010542A36|nr:DUF6600 domain-containing protein [Legionella yabuuchiae]
MNRYIVCLCQCFLVLFLISITYPSRAAMQDNIYPQVARISYFDGTVSYLPAGEKKWVKAILNRPATRGSQIWTPKQARVELQLSYADIQLNNLSHLKILNLTNRITQVQLNQGSIIVRVYKLNKAHTYEVSTPNLAFTFKQPGYYRIDVNKQDNTTAVTVKKGSGTAYGVEATFSIKSERQCFFPGRNLLNPVCRKLPKLDAFDKWREKKQPYAKQYTASGMIGRVDLDQHGEWITVKKYGRVWVPTKVSKNWAPYRTGRWVWISSWGWTWVDAQPWGFAPFHYGRWGYYEKRWVWVPGPVEVEPIYAPALVGFIGGTQFRLETRPRVSGIGWFPLAPGEVYIPPYQVNRNYFVQVNTSNTNINPTYVTNIYNNQDVNITYQNINTTEAVTAVPLTTFIQSEPVSENVVQLSSEEIKEATISQTATVAPTSSSVLGAPTTTEIAPSMGQDETTIVANEPPPQPASFQEEQKILEQDPGVPLDSTESEKLATTDENVMQSEAATEKMELSPSEKPAPAPVEKPAPAPVEEPAPTPVEEPAPAPVEEPAPTPVEEPAPAPVEEPAPAPVEEPAPAPVEEPAPALVEEPAPAPVEEPAPAPVEEPAPAPVEEPAPAPVEEPAPTSVEEPAPAPVEEPAPAPVEEPAPTSVEEPAPAPVEEPSTALDEESAPAS